MDGNKIFIYGSLGSLAAGLATSIGVIPVIFLKKTLSEKQLDILLGFAAGVMLAATMFSLIMPSIKTGGVFICALGLFTGAIIIDLFDTFSPHEHFLKGHEGPDISVLKKIWLFVIAIALHNFPEGLAVGVSFGGGDEMIKNGLVVATAMAIQNILEGTATAVSFLKAGYSKKQAFRWTLYTGLIEPVGGLTGALLMAAMTPALPFFLAFAGGAMLYVISDEIIPETHAHNNERAATFSLLSGFMLMTILDTMLG